MADARQDFEPAVRDGRVEPGGRAGGDGPWARTTGQPIMDGSSDWSTSDDRSSPRVRRHSTDSGSATIDASCRTRSGSRSGDISHEENQDIQLCVSVPLGDVEIDA